MLSNTTTTTTTTSSTTTTRSPPARRLTGYTIHYDIWLVNGLPSAQHNNRLEHQFSYDVHDIVEIYVYSLAVYLFILPFILYRLRTHFHYLYTLLAVYVGVELVSRLFSLVHNLVFAYDGRGLYFMQFAGELVESLGGGLFIFILLVIARGWTIRSRELNISRRSYFMGFVLLAILVSSHMISLVGYYLTH